MAERERGILDKQFHEWLRPCFEQSLGICPTLVVTSRSHIPINTPPLPQAINARPSGGCWTNDPLIWRHPTKFLNAPFVKGRCKPQDESV